MSLILKDSQIYNLLEQCEVIAKNSKCSRKKFGAILTTSEGINISGGYNGSSRGCINCGTDIMCLKDIHNEAHYTSYEHCPAIHAEINVVLNAARTGRSTLNTYMFLAERDGKASAPCIKCKMFLINAGVLGCYYKDKNNTIHFSSATVWKIDVNDWIKSQAQPLPVKFSTTFDLYDSLDYYKKQYPNKKIPPYPYGASGDMMPALCECKKCKKLFWTLDRVFSMKGLCYECSNKERK